MMKSSTAAQPDSRYETVTEWREKPIYVVRRDSVTPEDIAKLEAAGAVVITATLADDVKRLA
jgi:hypothetical protein